MEKLKFWLQTLWGTIIALTAFFIMLKTLWMGWTIDEPTNKQLAEMVANSLCVIMIVINISSKDDKE